MKELNSLDEVKTFVTDNMINIVMFTTTTCIVCKPLKEKIIKKFTGKVPLGTIMVDNHKEAAANYGIYSAPITILFVDGKEIARYALALNLDELDAKIERFEELIA